MKAVNVLLLLFISLIAFGQNEIIFESSYLDFDKNTCLLEEAQFDRIEFASIEQKKMFSFKATFYKSYNEEYVLVEIDSMSDFQYIVIEKDSVFTKTSLRRFVIPTGRFKVKIVFAPCKYMKTYIDVRPCHSELKYTLIQPSTPYDDDGMLIIHSIDKSSWYFSHDPKFQIASDTLYNVHAGYYEILGESTFGCKEKITIPVIHQGGKVKDLESFDFDRLTVTKG